MTNEIFPLADLSGSPYQIGYQHGQLFKDKILGSINTYTDMFEDYSDLSWDRAKELSRKFIPIIENYKASYLEEIRGVADGSGFDFEDILALNCRSELVFAGKEMDDIGGPINDGCTSIGLTSQATKNGDTIVAHNWDWKTSQRQNEIMLRITQEDNKPKIFMITEAGIIGKTGYNSAGISVFLNALGTDAPPKGVPLHMVMRSILDCETIGEAIREASREKIGCCASFLIGHSNGEVINIEIENEDFDVLYPENGVLVHTNHFLSQRLPIYPRIDTVKYRYTDSFLRLGRTIKLIMENYGQLDEEIIANILSDHVDYPNSICSHDDPKLEKGLRSGTVFSIIINLSKDKIYFAKGNPCENDYENYQL